MSTELLARLRKVVPADRILTDPQPLAAYSHDDAEWADFVPPLAVVRAKTTEEVSAVVRIAASTGVRIVPRGAGTGLSGGANAVANSLVLTLELMTGILEINPDERFVRTQAGVLNDSLREAVAAQGLWYPPDPASYKISTIGGNIATNAGGLCCVKYGVTRDYVLGLKVVLADGSVVDLGRRTAKGVAGYDLTALMVGSEGTLGIVTEATLKLLPLHGRENRAVTGYFNDLVDAGNAVAAVSRAGIIPAALELVDRTCLQAVDDWQQLGLSQEGGVLLLASVDEPGARGEELSRELHGIFTAAGATKAERSLSAAHAEELFLARRLAYPALERLGPVLTEDVCVPRTAVPEMLQRIESTARRFNTVIANIAHAGDGNLHPLIIAPVDDDDAKSRAKDAFDQIVADALELGGTTTGEHGVGLLKLPGMLAEFAPRVIDMHRSVKNALDPQGLLNPGKAFPA
ncbi:FAD-linked oxidase C-terminal domain-containing protein [Paenarthrobacter sp. PH39-S1]|uniref:FAD-binding oxidoreductase n=1 Tax=Paenarthrobacter sp. PH39-S1 TaxID=3046204 RepID=UPI0024B9AA15|nr:FAD-linked oxidase C-terminal domain-containing protein [Paenarthrobacter sp. PH39-S1]MDJ0355681.1 FAD-linked oxidase C-terminal domain-containing protein [Paenarthrobacter sp. PH39-S1]